jgi:hypothetical protein
MRVGWKVRSKEQVDALIPEDAIGRVLYVSENVCRVAFAWQMRSGGYRRETRILHKSTLEVVDTAVDLLGKLVEGDDGTT